VDANDLNNDSQGRKHGVWWTALLLSLGLHVGAGSLLLPFIKKLQPFTPQAPGALSVRLLSIGAHVVQPSQSQEAGASSLLQDLASLPPPLAQIPETGVPETGVPEARVPEAPPAPAPSSPPQTSSHLAHKKSVPKPAAKPLLPSRAKLSPAQTRHPKPEQPHTAQPAPKAEPASETASVGSKASLQPQYGAPPLIAAHYDAAYLHNPAPEYPPMARRLGLQGTARLKVLVSAQGLAQEVRLSESSGSGALDRAAVESVRRWRFVPARRGDMALASWVEVPVRFVLR